MMNFIFIKEIAEKKQKRGKEKAKTSDTKKKEIILLNLLEIQKSKNKIRSRFFFPEEKKIVEIVLDFLRIFLFLKKRRRRKPQEENGTGTKKKHFLTMTIK